MTRKESPKQAPEIPMASNPDIKVIIGLRFNIHLESKMTVALTTCFKCLVNHL